MKKAKQLSINSFVNQNYARMMHEFTHSFFKDATQLRTCKAWVYETKNFFVLRSYNSIVAFIEKDIGLKFDVLRKVYGYTATSAQHIAKFFSDYSDSRAPLYTYRGI